MNKNTFSKLHNIRRQVYLILAAFAILFCSVNAAACGLQSGGLNVSEAYSSAASCSSVSHIAADRLAAHPSALYLSGQSVDSISPDTLPEALEDVSDVDAPKESSIPLDSTSEAIVAGLKSLISSTEIFNRTQLGLYVYDLTTDAPLFAQGEQQQLRPASCEKILTAAAGLHALGTDYKYTTTLSIDGEISDSTLQGNVYLRGAFDPLLDDDDLRAFVKALNDRGIKTINGSVCFDRSFKDTTTMGWGWCWDDDMEPLTPLLFKKKPTLEKNFLAALAGDSIRTTGGIQYALVPSSAETIATRSHTIDQILLTMMKESNNLFAESLFYHLAAKGEHQWADSKRGRKAVGRFLVHCGVKADTYQVADGSGVSLYNYTTPEALVRVLRYVYRHDDLYRHLHPALPIAGKDGTLRKRMTSGKAHENVHAKTGTVEGVSTLAGYATAPNGHILCFAIMNQGIRHTSTGRSFQDKVCRVLCGEEL